MPTCPICGSEFIFDEEIGLWYCPKCDIVWDEDDLFGDVAEMEAI